MVVVVVVVIVVVVVVIIVIVVSQRQAPNDTDRSLPHIYIYTLGVQRPLKK